MNTLVISQTIFYIISSVAMLAVGTLLVIVMYYFICILKDTRNITEDVNKTYSKFKKSFKKIISSIINKKS